MLGPVCSPQFSRFPHNSHLRPRLCQSAPTKVEMGANRHGLDAILPFRNLLDMQLSFMTDFSSVSPPFSDAVVQYPGAVFQHLSMYKINFRFISTVTRDDLSTLARVEAFSRLAGSACRLPVSCWGFLDGSWMAWTSWKGMVNGIGPSSDGWHQTSSRPLDHANSRQPNMYDKTLGGTWWKKLLREISPMHVEEKKEEGNGNKVQ